MKLKYIVSHYYPLDDKAKQMFSDPVYLNIGSGKLLKEEAARDQWTREHIIFDDSLQPNIAHLNFTYCELTNFWFAWKHPELIGDADYIATGHYRRTFKLDDLHKQIEAKPDVVCATAASLGFIGWHYGLINQFRCAHKAEWWDTLVEVIKQSRWHSRKPEVLSRWPSLKLLPAPCNCLCLKRELFGIWMEELFKAMEVFYTKHQADIPKLDNYQKRMVSFVAERFTSWLVCLMSSIGFDVKAIPIEFRESMKPATANDKRGEYGDKATS